MNKRLYVKKIIRVPGKEYREANLTSIHETYTRKDGLTYRVTQSCGHKTMMCGRYKTLREALIVRDCMLYLNEKNRKSRVASPYHTEIDLQRIASKRRCSDMFELYFYMLDNKSLQKTSAGSQSIQFWRQP